RGTQTRGRGSRTATHDGDGLCSIIASLGEGAAECSIIASLGEGAAECSIIASLGEGAAECSIIASLGEALCSIIASVGDGALEAAGVVQAPASSANVNGSARRVAVGATRCRWVIEASCGGYPRRLPPVDDAGMSIT